MSKLKRIWVIHTTSRAEGAESDDGLRLMIRVAAGTGAVVANLVFPELPHDERERGRTDEYRFDVESLRVERLGLSPRSFAVVTGGRDAWLPASFWVIGETVNGERELLASVSDWPSTAWLSNDSAEGQGSYTLNELAGAQ